VGCFEEGPHREPDEGEHFEELFMRKYIDSASMPDHITAMLNIKCHITQASKDLKDIIVAQAIIISLLKTQTWA
jgi:hypothetical protein